MSEKQTALALRAIRLVARLHRILSQVAAHPIILIAFACILAASSLDEVPIRGTAVGNFSTTDHHGVWLVKVGFASLLLHQRVLQHKALNNAPHLLAYRPGYLMMH